MEVLVNTARLIMYDQATEHAFGDPETLKEKVAIAFMHPNTMKQLTIKNHSNVKLRSEHGSIVLMAKEDDSMPEGVVTIPVSLWANQITGTMGEELIYKNFKVKIEPTTEPVPSLENLINKLKGVKGGV
ncbi:MAG: molybdopterin dinucleotide binding domain-containing protein [Promethearchaeota archaeon]